jgi:hypothetical protein
LRPYSCFSTLLQLFVIGEGIVILNPFKSCFPLRIPVNGVLSIF